MRFVAAFEAAPVRDAGVLDSLREVVADRGTARFEPPFAAPFLDDPVFLDEPPRALPPARAFDGDFRGERAIELTPSYSLTAKVSTSERTRLLLLLFGHPTRKALAGAKLVDDVETTVPVAACAIANRVRYVQRELLAL